ncbi:MAG: tRNA1(Val) (adenine(37)-N6)-methyltransferase [Bacillota bacterium]|jgi:tRNA1Val (adenine37-N6)-methyltransferase
MNPNKKLGNQRLEIGIRLKPEEYLVDLIRGGLKLIESRSGYHFTMDAVLLAHFVTVKSGDRVADLGSGSGIIPLLLNTRLPDLSIWGIEIQENLLDRARRSVAINGLQQQIDLQHGDLREIPAKIPAADFEVVVSNPPYRPLRRGRSSPCQEVAWAREEVSSTLGEVINSGYWLLRTGGRLALVHLWERRQEVVDLLLRYGMRPVRYREVRHNQQLAPSRFLVEAIKMRTASMVDFPGAGELDPERAIELARMEPLVIYEMTGEFTSEVKAMYYG